MRIAVVGSGIAGLGSAWMLNRDGHAVTLFEAEDRFGGHTHTVDVRLEGVSAPVDTGFLVFNDRTYPNLIRLFDDLGVASVASDMSFSVRVDSARLEWAGTSLRSVFAQPRNLARPAFWGLLLDIARFNREAMTMVQDGKVDSLALGEYLERGGYRRAFRDWYLIPMAAAIWSSPRRDILDFPLPTFLSFCANHGLLQVVDRPQWRTVSGGGRAYVRKIIAELPDARCNTPVTKVRRTGGHVEVETRGGLERYDQVVFACHSRQALALLADPSADERRALRAVRFQPNRVVLHTDVALMPRARVAWSAWNYLSADDPGGTRPVAVTYWINRLQPLPFRAPVLVTLNPPIEPDPRRILAQFDVEHPLLDAPAVAAQKEIEALQGKRRTWYAGAWLGYGFHEDGLDSALRVAAQLRGRVETASAVREAA